MEIVYHKSVLNLFEQEVNKYGLVETGGVLLGHSEPDLIMVMKASTCGPNAIHEDFYFRADKNYIDMIIDMEYANSNGKISYLGEWHTHPQVVPEPSLLDLNSLGEIVESSETINLLLIIGAIEFKASRFVNQSISIVKRPNDPDFYKVLPRIHNT